MALKIIESDARRDDNSIHNFQLFDILHLHVTDDPRIGGRYDITYTDK